MWLQLARKCRSFRSLPYCQNSLRYLYVCAIYIICVCDSMSGGEWNTCVKILREMMGFLFLWVFFLLWEWGGKIKIYWAFLNISNCIFYTLFSTATLVRCSVSCSEINDFLIVIRKNIGCKLTDGYFTVIYNMIKISLLMCLVSLKLSYISVLWSLYGSFFRGC